MIYSPPFAIVAVVLALIAASLAQSASEMTGKLRVLALFSTTNNELGLDHRLGRQVLKLASQKAIRMNPKLANKLELLVENNDFECSSTNEMPNKVAELYYSQQSTESCKREELANCTEQDIDSKQLNKYFPPASIRRFSRSDQPQLDSDKAVEVILGPSCHYLVDLIGRMAAYWQLPIYSVASIGAQFADKQVFSTLTRLSPSIDQLSLFIMRTMQRFNWIHLAILVDPSQVENALLLENLEQTIAHQAYLHPIKRKVFTLNSGEIRPPSGKDKGGISKQHCSQEARRILMESRRVARVVLLLLNGQQTVRQLLLCAHELGFHRDGFTFLAMDLGLKSMADNQAAASQQARSQTKSSQQQQQQPGFFDWYVADDEENNALAKQMFESLMVFSVELPTGDEYNLFVEQTLELAHQQYPQARFERSSVNSLAVALHDSLLLAVEAHLRHHDQRPPQLASDNEPDESDYDEQQNDVRKLGRGAPLLWNEHIRPEAAARIGFVSASLQINSNGDQELSYVLSDLEPELGIMRPVASFARETRQLEFIADTYIHWPARLAAAGSAQSGRTASTTGAETAPPDEPECGFDGLAERCVDRQNLHAALTILASLIGLLAVGSALSLYKYRNIKYQMQLDDYWWKISWQDLQFVQMTESLASNAQSIARALKSGGSVVANSDGASSMVSILRPSQVAAARISAGNRSLVGAAAAAGDGDGHESAVSKVLSPQPQQQQQQQQRGRRQAVPLIVTSPGSRDAATPPAAQSSIADGGGGGGATRATSGSLLGAGSAVLIRSEFSSVVRASNLAMYKGELVIVKQLNADSIEMSRELLVELKSIRELVHDNLARFVGLCLDPERLAIVYEFCSRGSLQDLILNKDVAMDLTLKYSIIGDIVNGLSFIHTTLLDYHGRLKSTNLVLDGRFTVKITDFGLQKLYSQLELIEHQARDDDDDGESDDDDDHLDGARRGAADAVSLSVSQAAYQMESISVVGERRQRRLSGRRGREGGVAGAGRARLRNRGAARFFWTAPEHLREKSAHQAGSKKGDVYSLGIIFFELLTRREPYFYGTNAQPHWPSINRDRRTFIQQSQLQQQQSLDGQSASSRLLSSVSRRSRQSVRAQNQQLAADGRRSISHHLKHNSVAPAPIAEAAADAISIISGSSVHQQQQQQQQGMRPSVGAIDEENPDSFEPELGSQLGNSELRHQVAPLHLQSHQRTRAGSGAGGNLAIVSNPKERLDAEEILDQLRMGIQPEPVRPYIPQYVAHAINPKLIELARACWSESPQARPTLGQVRTQLRNISRGLASRNYLDNLLDRLQNYAAELERIVDSKSADIMGEKLRTEELLYQLVPKFVADQLKRSEPVVPQLFDGVTIFFSDIVGFEKYASVMSPIELVDLLNSIYSSFDSIISSFDVTKIETIIDQFLVAAGISFQERPLPSAAAAPPPQLAPAAAAEEATSGGAESAPADAGKKGPKRAKLKRIGLLGSLGKGESQDKAAGGQQQQANRSDSLEQQVSQQVPATFDSSHYRRSSAEQIGRMALCIRDLVKSFHFRQNLSNSSGQQQQNQNQNQQPQQQSPLVASTFNIRIGIHSGKVCAGIVGVKRPKFCLIGDTVNVASRMHTNSKANRIQISDDTRQLLEQVPGFSIEPRGKIEVKGKGLMETFWLESSY